MTRFSYKRRGNHFANNFFFIQKFFFRLHIWNGRQPEYVEKGTLQIHIQTYERVVNTLKYTPTERDETGKDYRVLSTFFKQSFTFIAL